MTHRQIAYTLQDRWTYLWLWAATVLSVFSLSVGKWLIPVTAWLGAIFYIRFFRTQGQAWLAYLLMAVSTAIATAVSLPSYMRPTAMSILIGSSRSSATCSAGCPSWGLLGSRSGR